LGEIRRLAVWYALLVDILALARDIGDSGYKVHERNGARVDEDRQREERDLSCGDAHYGDDSGIDFVGECEMVSEGSGAV
jgi:hypothetical protein